MFQKAGKNYKGDFLIAASSQANFSAPLERNKHLSAYSLNEAQRLRSRVLGGFGTPTETSLMERAPEFRDYRVGQPVQMAGSLADMINLALTPEYRDLAVKAAQVYLVDHGQFLLIIFPKLTSMRPGLSSKRACNCALACWSKRLL